MSAERLLCLFWGWVLFRCVNPAQCGSASGPPDGHVPTSAYFLFISLYVVVYEIISVFMYQVTSGGDMAGPSGVEVCLSPIATTTDDGPIVRYVNTGIDGR